MIMSLARSGSFCELRLCPVNTAPSRQKNATEGPHSHPLSGLGASRSSMGSLLRSEPMTLIQIIEAKGAARNVVNTLGDLGVVQFRDVR